MLNLLSGTVALPRLLAFSAPGLPELIVLAVIVLLLFGSRLPSTMKSLGMSITSFKKGMKEGEDEDNERLDKES